MTGRMNWSLIGSRLRMRRQGVEDIKGKTPLVEQLPKARHKLKLSKAELRQAAAAAFLAWRAGQTAEDK